MPSSKRLDFSTPGSGYCASPRHFPAGCSPLCAGLAFVWLNQRSTLVFNPESSRKKRGFRDVEEMTVDEIGTALNLTREAVKGRLHRARALLREYLLGGA